MLGDETLANKSTKEEHRQCDLCEESGALGRTSEKPEGTKNMFGYTCKGKSKAILSKRASIVTL